MLVERAERGVADGLLLVQRDARQRPRAAALHQQVERVGEAPLERLAVVGAVGVGLAVREREDLLRYIFWRAAPLFWCAARAAGVEHRRRVVEPVELLEPRLELPHLELPVLGVRHHHGRALDRRRHVQRGRAVRGLQGVAPVAQAGEVRASVRS